MNLCNILPQAIISHPEKVAVICTDKEFTYKQFGSRVGKLTNALLEFGITKGPRTHLR